MDTLITMQNELLNTAPGHPYYTQLHAVCQKINQLLGDVDSDDPFYHNYIIYGRKYANTVNLKSQLKKLDNHDYKNKILKIQYTPYGSPQLTLLFAVGVVIYCLEKDTLYLLGINQDDKITEEFSPFTIIDMNTIDVIDDTDLEVRKYIWDETQNADIPVADFFREISETMLSISIEPTQKVEVVFERSEKIEQDLAHFHSQRKRSVIHKTEDAIIYADQILSLKPEALKNWIIFSTERSLGRYLQDDAETGCEPGGTMP